MTRRSTMAHKLVDSRLQPKIEAEIRRRGMFDSDVDIIYLIPSKKWDRAHHVRACILATEAGRVVCGARRKTGDSETSPLCRNRPAAQGNRCRLHGGESLSGHLAPMHVGRGYSIEMPQHLAQKFEQALLDPDLASLGAELALIDTRTRDLLSSVEDTPSSEQVQAAMEEVSDALACLGEENFVGARDHLVEAQDYLASVGEDAETWDNILKAIEQRRKLASEERKREDKLEATMTARQAMTFVAALKVAITEEIEDDTVRARVGYRLAKLLGENTNG